MPSSYYGPRTVPSALWDSAHCFLLAILDGTVSDPSFDEKAQTQRYQQQKAHITVKQGMAGLHGPEFLRCLRLGSCFTFNLPEQGQEAVFSPTRFPQFSAVGWGVTGVASIPSLFPSSVT